MGKRGGKRGGHLEDGLDGIGFPTESVNHRRDQICHVGVSRLAGAIFHPATRSPNGKQSPRLQGAKVLAGDRLRQVQVSSQRADGLIWLMHEQSEQAEPGAIGQSATGAATGHQVMELLRRVARGGRRTVPWGLPMNNTPKASPISSMSSMPNVRSIKLKTNWPKAKPQYRRA